MAAYRPTRRRFLALAAGGAAAVLAPGGAGAIVRAAASGPADTVFLGGSIITVDARRKVAKALAVTGGKIAYVGGEAGVQDLIGSATEVVDLGGGALMPGIHDGHVHPLYAGRLLTQCSLGYLPLTVDEMRAVIQACLDATSDQEPDGWLRVADWALQSMQPPGVPVVKDILDVLVTQRPIIVRATDGHNALVNSRALAIADVTSATPDPVDGTIVRDAQGEPTGHLIDGAIGLVEQFVPEPTFEEDLDAMRTALGVLAARGVTTLNDALTFEYVLQVYDALQTSGELTARVHADLVLDRAFADHMPAVLEEFARLRDTYSNGRLVVRTVKLFEDGVMEYPIQTAALLEPYLIEVDGEWVPGPSRGPLYFEPEVIRRTVTKLDASDWRVHIHAIGDRAVRAALDAYEAARTANGRNNHRHAIAHLQLVDPDDLPRFAELGVIPTMQLQWAERDSYTMEALRHFIGKERWSRQYPARSMREAGAFLAAGSDWPVDPSGPFDAIQQAVTRTGPFPGKYAEPLNPDQGIRLAEAIELHTTHAAFLVHQEGITGSLEVGKDADVIQVDQDPLAVPIEEVRSTTVIRTFLQGETVYDASSASAAVRGLLEADRRLAAIGGRRRGLFPRPGCC